MIPSYRVFVLVCALQISTSSVEIHAKGYEQPIWLAGFTILNGLVFKRIARVQISGDGPVIQMSIGILVYSEFSVYTRYNIQR